MDKNQGGIKKKVNIFEANSAEIFKGGSIMGGLNGKQFQK